MKQEHRNDPVHSSAQFMVRNMRLRDVREAFSGIQGNVSCDPDDLQSTCLVSASSAI